MQCIPDCEVTFFSSKLLNPAVPPAHSSRSTLVIYVLLSWIEGILHDWTLGCVYQKNNVFPSSIYERMQECFTAVFEGRAGEKKTLTCAM